MMTASIRQFWQRLCLLFLCAGLAFPVTAQNPVAAQNDGARDGETVAPVLWLPAMNVFRRHSAPSEEMFAFYGHVLGLQQLQTYDVGGGTNVSRFQVGASELKLTGQVADRRYVPGGVEDATGVRLLGFFFPDQQALEQRFRDAGLEAPRFRPLPDSTRSAALVQDPDGQWLKLVAAPGEDEAVYRQVEIGLTVSDLEQSEAFYRDFVGLKPLEPVHDPLFNTMKHSYRNGSTIISLRSFGEDLPSDTGSGGIQYVVSDADHVDRLARQRDIVIDQPLSELEGFSLRTIWLDDPDGITNYFAETGQSSQEPPPNP